MTNYTIFSKPKSIGFECPYCQEEQEIRVEDLQESVFELTSVECPQCHNEVELDDWEYD